MSDPISTLQALVSIPAPPGQECALADELERRVQKLGHQTRRDAKGNLFVGSMEEARVVVTAHMDEIAMMVTGVNPDGSLSVTALGGFSPWKFGEGLVLVMGDEGVNGIMSFGSVHTDDPGSRVRIAEEQGLGWREVRIETGLTPSECDELGIGPGTRVVIHPDRRKLSRFGPKNEFVAGYFLDDRSDLVAWLQCLEGDLPPDVTFIATVSEEVGGHGALFALHKLRPDVCIALELGPAVDDAPIEVSAAPTLWVNDSYAAMAPADIALVKEVAAANKIPIQLQALSRGGSDASCAASHGLCGRPITIGIPMGNTHGYEYIHEGGMEAAGSLVSALIPKLLQ